MQCFPYPRPLPVSQFKPENCEKTAKQGDTVHVHYTVLWSLGGLRSVSGGRWQEDLRGAGVRGGPGVVPGPQTLRGLPQLPALRRCWDHFSLRRHRDRLAL